MGCPRAEWLLEKAIDEGERIPEGTEGFMYVDEPGQVIIDEQPILATTGSLPGPVSGDGSCLSGRGGEGPPPGCRV